VVGLLGGCFEAQPRRRGAVGEAPRGASRAWRGERGGGLMRDHGAGEGLGSAGVKGPRRGYVARDGLKR